MFREINNCATNICKIYILCNRTLFAFHKYDDNTVHLNINLDTRTRGHIKKLVVRRCRYDV